MSVKELCPAEAEALEQSLTKFGVSMEALAETFQWDEPELDILETAICRGSAGRTR